MREEEIETFLKKKFDLQDIEAYFITVVDTNKNAKYISYGQSGDIERLAIVGLAKMIRDRDVDHASDIKG